MLQVDELASFPCVQTHLAFRHAFPREPRLPLVMLDCSLASVHVDLHCRAYCTVLYAVIPKRLRIDYAMLTVEECFGETRVTSKSLDPSRRFSDKVSRAGLPISWVRCELGVIRV